MSGQSWRSVLLIGLLVMLAAGEFVGGLEHPGYDSHESPGLIIAVSAGALLCGLAALRIAVNRLRGRGGRLDIMLG